MFGHVVDGYKSEFPFPGTSFPAYPSRPSPARWWVRLKLGWPSAPLLLLFNPGPARRWLGPVNCLPPPVVTCPPPGQDVTPRLPVSNVFHWPASLPGITMFSLFSKSKTVDSSQPDLTHVPRDVRSCVSVSASKEHKRERKKSRSRNFRGLFSSDCEDEITSVVSDNPQLYHSHRSCSMVSCTNGHSRSQPDQ